MKWMLLLLSLTLAACGPDDDSSTSSESNTTEPTGNGTTTVAPSVDENNLTGNISENDFFITYDVNAAGAIFDEDLNYTRKSVSINIHTNEFSDRVVSTSQTIKFRTSWGSFDNTICNLNSNGSCTVTWFPGDRRDMFDTSCRIAITALTTGEEYFVDVNDNQMFDEGETFFDIEEPYLDVDRSGTYTAGEVIGVLGNPKSEAIDVEEFSGGTTNGVHDTADGIYNGSLCADVAGNAACVSDNISTVIWAKQFLLVQTPFDEEEGEDNNQNAIPGEKDINFCI